MGTIIKMHPTAPAGKRKPNPVPPDELGKKVSEYKSFLKGDSDFDYAYILRMLKYKLKRTREHIVKHNIIVGAGEIGLEIRKVEKLLQRVIDDKYEEKRWRNLERKYGKGLYRLGTKVPDEMRQDMSAASEAAFLERKADLKKAFDIILEKMWFWWD